ncbi:MAG TPA: hypothetical protein VL171_02940 [Verrucomicrobiae bacterium]|nr:hypothetical protein [Verrucomicrobiae bacterium]
MSSYSIQTSANRWHSILTVTVTCIASWSTARAAPAQKSESPTVMASLSVSTIQPEFTLAKLRERPNLPAPQIGERTDWPLPVRHGKPTDAEAWEKFETEYRPEPWLRSPVKRQIETVKYGLDTTVFAVDHFVKSIRDHADFEFRQRGLHRTRANSLGGPLDNPRVKLDLEILRSKPYVGVRVVIPFGN